jgi:hypothetical protein
MDELSKLCHRDFVIFRQLRAKGLYRTTVGNRIRLLYAFCIDEKRRIALF